MINETTTENYYFDKDYNFFYSVTNSRNEEKLLNRIFNYQLKGLTFFESSKETSRATEIPLHSVKDVLKDLSHKNLIITIDKEGTNNIQQRAINFEKCNEIRISKGFKEINFQSVINENLIRLGKELPTEVSYQYDTPASVDKENLAPAVVFTDDVSDDDLFTNIKKGLDENNAEDRKQLSLNYDSLNKLIASKTIQHPIEEANKPTLEDCIKAYNRKCCMTDEIVEMMKELAVEDQNHFFYYTEGHYERNKPKPAPIKDEEDELTITATTLNF